MSATPQSQAIQVANTYFGLVQQLVTLYQQIKVAKQQWGDDGVANVVAALQTAPLSADGTLGVADGSPNVAHPVDTRIYTTLNRAISANQLNAVVSMLDNIPTFVDSVAAVPQMGGVRAILNSACNG